MSAFTKFMPDYTKADQNKKYIESDKKVIKVIDFKADKPE